MESLSRPYPEWFTTLIDVLLDIEEGIGTEYERLLNQELEMINEFLVDIDTSAYHVEMPIGAPVGGNARALYELYRSELDGKLDIPIFFEEIIRTRLINEGVSEIFGNRE